MRKLFVIISTLILLGSPLAAADANQGSFPLDRGVTRNVGYNSGIVFIRQRVTTKVTPDGTTYFKYAYTVTYSGPDQILFSWALLDPFLSGRSAQNIFPMKDGTTYNFVFESLEKPIWARGQAVLFRLGRTDDINGFYILIRDITQEGPLPPSFLKYLKER